MFCHAIEHGFALRGAYCLDAVGDPNRMPHTVRCRGLFGRWGIVQNVAVVLVCIWDWDGRTRPGRTGIKWPINPSSPQNQTSYVCRMWLLLPNRCGRDPGHAPGWLASDICRRSGLWCLGPLSCVSSLTLALTPQATLPQT